MTRIDRRKTLFAKEKPSRQGIMPEAINHASTKPICFPKR
jgi:hypothetical protein